MRVLSILLLIISVQAYHAFGALEELNLDDLEGLLPSFWLDHTGFHLDSEIELANDLTVNEPLIPLMPLYQSGALGKKIYVGGVLESKYIQGMSQAQLQRSIQKIRETNTPEGIPLYPYAYDGKIYAVRGDYQVTYQRSVTIGLSLSFGGGGKTVVLGDSHSYGIKLDFSPPLRVRDEQGINLMGPLQKIITDWSGAIGPDESQAVIDQAVRITPTLMSHFTQKPLELVDAQGSPLEKLRGQEAKDLMLNPQPAALDKSGQHTREWLSTKSALVRGLRKEVKWRTDTEHQTSSEKILESAESNELIQRICDRIATIYETPQEIWPRCHISATLTPNAWAYPGGNIFITTGLLGILSEVDSVALVLGHEIGHVMGRHTTRQMPTRKAFVYASSYLSTAVNLGLTVFSLGGGLGALGNVNFLTWYPQAMASSLGGAFVAKKGLELAFLAPTAGLMLQSRDLEREADRLGQEAAYGAGADLSRMNQGWEEFISFFERNFPEHLGIKQKIMADHPDGQSRLQNFERKSTALRQLLQNQNEKNLFDDEFKASYRRIHHRLRPYTEAYGRSLRQRYDSLQVRRAGARDEHKLRHFMHTMVGPHSLCVQHALGAE